MHHHRSLDPRFSIAPDARTKYVRHIQELMRSRDARVIVAQDTDAGTLIGYVVGELQDRPPIAMPGRYGFISDIYVAPGWRRIGVGRGLFVTMKGWFVDRRATAIELYTANANPAAVQFWKEMGLEPFLTLTHVDL